MQTVRHLGVLSVMVSSLLVMSGCQWEDGPTPAARADDALSEAQTRERQQTLIPISTLLGIELRKPMDLPACDMTQETPSVTCADGNLVFLHAAEVPDYLERPSVTVVRGDDGNVESIGAYPKRDWSKVTLAMLAAKFGQPDALGVQVPGYTLRSWTYKDAAVDYIDNGNLILVTLATSEQQERDRREAEKEAKAREQRDARKRVL